MKFSSETYTSTKPRDPNEPRHLSNMKKELKDAVLEAIKESGQAVEWSDVPNEQMPFSMRDQYGSVWSLEPSRDCSKFWAAYRAVSSQDGASK